MALPACHSNYKRCSQTGMASVCKLRVARLQRWAGEGHERDCASAKQLQGRCKPTPRAMQPKTWEGVGREVDGERHDVQCRCAGTTEHPRSVICAQYYVYGSASRYTISDKSRIKLGSSNLRIGFLFLEVGPNVADTGVHQT